MFVIFKISNKDFVSTMRPYIKDIVNNKGDGNYGFQVIARHLGMNEEDHVLVRQALIHELRNHKSDYMPIYDTEERYNKILNGLHPPKCTSCIAPVDKWLTTPDMGHIIASCYKRPCSIDFDRNGWCM